MKRNLMTAAVLCVILMTGTGCGDDKTAYFETPETVFAAETEQSSESGENTEDALAEQELCYVYVCGAVKEPGVYVLEAHARIYEAIEAAGGLTEEADLETVNQAEEVSDGQMVKILTKEEAKALSEGAASGDVQTTASDGAEAEADGRMDINRASAEELMTLPGIGSAKAESIISYREKNGGFSSIEEIMQVEGIKEGVFNRVKDSIKVK